MGIAEEIKKTQNQPEMLRRALERIIQLYTDKSHFVYELLQNAEDSHAKSIRFDQYEDCLEVFHDGKPFTVQNLSALCDIGKSDKINDLNQIGEFGVGFKSVFGICETVQLFSNPHHYSGEKSDECRPFAIEINDFTNPCNIPEIEIPGGYTTKFVFKYAVGYTFSGFKTINELNRVLSQRLEHLGITTLLFMKHLELIEYRIFIGGNQKKGEYLLEKETKNDHCVLVSALGQSEKTNEEISYLTFSRTIDSKQSNRTIDIAFPVKVEPNGSYIFQQSNLPFISVYFPTETESKLNFIVQGPYRTTPNRSSVPSNDDDNIQLARATAKLYYDSIVEMRDAGWLNMSLLRLLPMNVSQFENYSLFEPLYEATKNLYERERILPCKNGGYTHSVYAKIARNQDLAELLNDSLLSALINDRKGYKWLPTTLTETSNVFKNLYSFLTTEMKIEVIRPDGLTNYINANKNFLPQQNNEWISKLYSIFESIPAAFNKRGGSMLYAEFIKTATGKFVAPYRRDEKGQLYPNVFLPITNTDVKIDVEFVHNNLYRNHIPFFEEVLQIKKPNEFDYFIKDIRRRYTDHPQIDDKQHISDIKALLKFLKYPDYQDEVRKFIATQIFLRCGKRYVSPIRQKVFLESYNGINIKGYLSNLLSFFCVDEAFYQHNGITKEDLVTLGVKNDLICGNDITSGEYQTGNRGQPPHWNTSGEFRWELSILYLEKALMYIAENPNAMDSRLKSQTIFKLLQANESKLCGSVHISGNKAPDIDHADAIAVSVLKRNSDYHVKSWSYPILRWNGKWLYTQDDRLVAQSEITNDELNSDYYGPVKFDSKLYKILGFKEDSLKRFRQEYDKLPIEQKQSYFEMEFQRRYKMSVDEFERKILISAESEIEEQSKQEDTVYEFPIVSVRSWTSLKKHSADMLFSANPVVYESITRSIRSSNAGTQKAYIKNMYHVQGTSMFACQMCHTPQIDIEACGIELTPTQELDPMYLCLCPNCRSKYVRFRNNKRIIDAFIDSIKNLSDADISGQKPIEILVSNEKIWFAHTHIAEVRELFLLKQKCEKNTTSTSTIQKRVSETISSPSQETVVKGQDGLGKTIMAEKKMVSSFVGIRAISMEDITTGNKSFAPPAKEKVDRLIEFYNENGRFDCPIVVSCFGDKYLIEDKYLRYYVAKKLKHKEIFAKMKK